MSRTYWRSLRDLEGSPEFRAQAEREFPEGAAEPPDEVTRREMLTLIGASLSMAGLAACRRPVEHIVPYVAAPEEIVPGVPRRFATTMPFGRSAYGVVVESHEGRPTKIEGNELHPASAGRSSVLMQAAILGLYDPDRSQKVLHGGQPATWADFVAAWRTLAEGHAADGGASLALLTPSFASPTLARLAEAFRARYPRARLVTHEPSSDENVRAGIELATAGRSLDPLLNLENATVILALDADLFTSDPEGVRHARGFAQGRRAGTEGRTMNRLFSVEAAHTTTGALADHRLRLPSREAGAFLFALADRLAARGLSGIPATGAAVPSGVDPRWIDAVATDLQSHRGAGLIVAGPGQPPEVHAAVLGLNAALGNVGRTVSYHEPADAALPSRSRLEELVGAMSSGKIATLVILGGNPVYDAPGDLDFASAMGKVATTIALGLHLDETSSRATWHVPRAHFLEAWGDARAAGGLASAIQPLIAPLYGGRSDVELLGLLASGEDRPGYDLVRESWKPILGEAAFERSWNRLLHDGVAPGSELPVIVPEVNPSVVSLLSRGAGDRSPREGLEVAFRPSPWLHDGRFANCGWLQELPDPLTKVTWDNPALLSPQTASALGVGNEDVVRIESRGRSIELPVWIMPGQADGCIVLTLGYGRTLAGRVGNGVGTDVYPLRSNEALDTDSGAKVAATGVTRPLAPTQEHGSMEGRPIVREASLADYLARPGFAAEAVKSPPLVSLWNEKSWDKGHQWGMTIDLNTCVGCNACVVACQSENNVPIVGPDQVRRGREMHWIRVDRYFAGGTESPEVVFQPVPCMQCENAPCEQVCPVAATVHDGEGLNVMVYNRCIGTRYCSNNCPYKVRRFNFYNFTKDTPEVLKLAQNPDVTVRSRGVMEKCTYCLQRINAAKIDARLSGRTLKDGDVATACQQACPAGAIEFGDVTDRESRVARAKEDPRNYALLGELNTKPRTTYLAKVRNPHPDLVSS